MANDSDLNCRILMLGYLMGNPEALTDVDPRWFGPRQIGRVVRELQDRATNGTERPITELSYLLGEWGVGGTAYESVYDAIQALQERIRVVSRLNRVLDHVEASFGGSDSPSNETILDFMSKLEQELHGGKQVPEQRNSEQEQVLRGGDKET